MIALLIAGLVMLPTSALADGTAKDAQERGIRDYTVPTLAEIDRLENGLRAALAAERPFSEAELHLLTRCCPSHWAVGSFRAFGRERYLAWSEDKRESRRKYLRKRLDEGLLEYAREAAKERGLPAAAHRLQRLAALGRSMAEIADAQLRGKEVKDLAERFLALGTFLQSMLSGYGDEDPLSVCVPRLVDADGRILFQGCAGMDALWIRLPWTGERILCRGAVFSFRELISRTWISDDAWRERVRGKGPPQRPSWSAAFVAGAGGR